MTAKQEPTMIVKPDGAGPGRRAVPAEVPVALTYNGVSHVVMMATPHDIEDFAVGFSVTEGIVEGRAEIGELEVREVEQGLLVWMQIPEARFQALLEGRRNLVGQTGCGLCGVEEIEQAVRSYPKIAVRPRCGAAELFQALAGLRTHQPLNAETGAVHAAGFADWTGAFRSVREDVGRHNALDKLIGGLLREGSDLASGFVVLSSRCSFELVQKVLAVGIPMLVTISAPTALAVQLAKDHDLTLIALARGDSMLAFNDPFGLFS